MYMDAVVIAGIATVLLVVGFFVGVGIGVGMPAINSLIVESIPTKNRSLVLNLLGIGFGIGLVLANIDVLIIDEPP